MAGCTVPGNEITNPVMQQYKVHNPNAPDNLVYQVGQRRLIRLNGLYYQQDTQDSNWKEVLLFEISEEARQYWTELGPGEAYSLKHELIRQGVTVDPDREYVVDMQPVVMYTEAQLLQYMWWSWGDLIKMVKENPDQLIKREEMEAWWEANCYEKP